MRRFVVVIVLAVLAGAVCWFFGVGILPAIVIALVVACFGIVLRVVTPSGSLSEWPPGPVRSQDGDRHESSELSWAIRARGSGLTAGSHIDGRIVVRISRIAANRLAFRHLDLDNPQHAPAIRRLLGNPAYEVLTSGGKARVRITDVLGLLGILDSLARSSSRSVAITDETNSKK